MSVLDDQVDPVDYLRVTVSDITEMMSEMPTLLFSWLEKASDAAEVAAFKAIAVKEAKASAYASLKNSGEKLTEKHLEVLVELDPAVVAAKAEEVKTTRDAATFKNFAEALRTKRDMLVQLDADLRKNT